LATQQALYHRASCNRAARRGEYNAAMERTLASHQGFPDSRDLRHSDSQKTPYQTRRRPARGHRLGDGIEARGGRHFEMSGPAGSEMEREQVIPSQSRLLQLYFIRHGETEWVALRPAHGPHGHSVDRARRGRGARTWTMPPGDPICACADQPAATRATNVCVGRPGAGGQD
jgi:hypothetical protein